MRALVDYGRWFSFVLVLSLQLFALLTLLTAHLVPSAYSPPHASWAATAVDVALSVVLSAASIGCYLLATLTSPGHPLDLGGGGGGGGQRDVERGLVSHVGPGGSFRDDDGGSHDPRDRHQDDADRGAHQDGGGGGGDQDDDDDDAPSAPLLVSSAAAAAIPGQPRLPSRTGRQQLRDLAAAHRHHRGRQAQDRDARGGGGGADAAMTGRTTRRMSGVQVKSSGEARWCSKCDAPKPDRAHHCSSCGTCVLRMDHHCPWLASRCVGLRNHKPFFLFLLYTSLLCAFAAQDTARMLVAFVEAVPDGYETSPVAWAVLFFVAFIFGVALIPFTAYHAYLLLRNRTTLESMEGGGRIRVTLGGDGGGGDGRAPRGGAPREAVADRLRRIAGGRRGGGGGGGAAGGRRGGEESLTREERRALRRARRINVYDVGAAENWRGIMGRSAWAWLWPLGPPPETDGFSYLVDEAKLAELQRVTASILGDKRDDGGSGHGGGGGGGEEEEEDDDDGGGYARGGGSMIGLGAVRRGGGGGGGGARREEGLRFASGHGVKEWGPRPRRDFVLFGVDDGEAEEEGEGGRDEGEVGRPRGGEGEWGEQEDAEVWRS